MKEQKKITNLPASVKDKLLNVAKKNRADFNSILRQYFQERFLFRLSKSIYANNFILKGALLFLAYDISRLRPTQDIDLQGRHIPNDFDTFRSVMSEIVSIQTEDGVIFSTENISVENIKEDADYEGMRIKIKANLGTIRDVLRIDIGFGDPVVYGPNEITYPTILDFEAPVLHVYSIESAIAEKFEAIVSLGLSSSRMKDYVDILFFASNQSFVLSKLSSAMKITFAHRETDVQDAVHIFSDSFKTNREMQEMWNAFITKRNLQSSLNFIDVVDKLKIFIQPTLSVSVIDKNWNIELWNWE